MNITLKHYADYFIIALEIGLPVKDEIVAWADNLILNTSEPSIWMIDLSTSHKKSFQDTINILQDVEGQSNLNLSFKLVVAKISILYPSININNLDLFVKLYNWFLHHEEINRNIPIIDNYTIMAVEEFYITQQELDDSYYREFINIGKDYTSYLPNTS